MENVSTGSMRYASINGTAVNTTVSNVVNYGEVMEPIKTAQELVEELFGNRAGLTSHKLAVMDMYDHPVGYWSETAVLAKVEELLTNADASAPRIPVDVKARRMVSTAYALCFTASYPLLQSLAREHGYALAIHGSMATDFDLIAVPWIKTPDAPEVLIESLRSAVNGRVDNDPLASEYDETMRNPVKKFHGRLAWSIYLNDGRNGPYLDVSVIAAQVPTSVDVKEVAQMDWEQVRLNGGPPCFSTMLAKGERSGWHCGRAERWGGHGVLHEYISFEQMIAAVATEAKAAGQAEERERIKRIVEKWIPMGLHNAPAAYQQDAKRKILAAIDKHD